MIPGSRWHEELMLVGLVSLILAVGAARGCQGQRGLRLAELDAERLRAAVAANAPPAKAPAIAAAPAGPAIDVNTADASLLATLPRIGETMARDIVRTREALGGFDSIEQLLAVPGIGPRTLESLRPFVRFSPPLRPAAMAQAPTPAATPLTPPVSLPAPTAQAAPTPRPSPTPAPTFAVDLNTAGIEELMSLKGIGETRARAIIEHRTTKGLFQRPQQIVDVKGIGDRIYADNASRLVVTLP